MPPLKTYIFEHYQDQNVQIIIQAYNYLEAWEKLIQTTKNPADFRHKD